MAKVQTNPIAFPDLSTEQTFMKYGKAFWTVTVI